MPFTVIAGALILFELEAQACSCNRPAGIHYPYEGATVPTNARVLGLFPRGVPLPTVRLSYDGDPTRPILVQAQRIGALDGMEVWAFTPTAAFARSRTVHAVIEDGGPSANVMNFAVGDGPLLDPPVLEPIAELSAVITTYAVIDGRSSCDEISAGQTVGRISFRSSLLDGLSTGTIVRTDLTADGVTATITVGLDAWRVEPRACENLGACQPGLTGFHLTRGSTVCLRFELEDPAGNRSHQQSCTVAREETVDFHRPLDAPATCVAHTEVAAAPDAGLADAGATDGQADAGSGVTAQGNGSGCSSSPGAGSWISIAVVSLVFVLSRRRRLAMP